MKVFNRCNEGNLKEFKKIDFVETGKDKFSIINNESGFSIEFIKPKTGDFFQVICRDNGKVISQKPDLLTPENIYYALIVNA